MMPGLLSALATGALRAISILTIRLRDATSTETPKKKSSSPAQSGCGGCGAVASSF